MRFDRIILHIKRMNFYQFFPIMALVQTHSASHCATATSHSKSFVDFGKAQYNSVMRYSQIRA